MPSRQNQDSVEFYDYNQLLASAQVLVTSNDPMMFRPAVFEAIGALESYVLKVVVELLREKIPDLLVKWLLEKTKMDFDSRLKVLTPIALGRTEDIERPGLWKDYIKAKEYRNKATHTGKKVTREEARFVIKTVHAWMSYLGSTAEFDLSLLGLRKYIESNPVFLPAGIATQDRTRHVEEKIQGIIGRYYKKVHGLSAMHDMQEYKCGQISAIDTLLEFGSEKVAFEYKIMPQLEGVDQWLDSCRHNIIRKMRFAEDVGRCVIIVFFDGIEVPEEYRSFNNWYKDESMRIDALGIRIGGGENNRDVERYYFKSDS